MLELISLGLTNGEVAQSTRRHRARREVPPQLGLQEARRRQPNRSSGDVHPRPAHGRRTASADRAFSSQPAGSGDAAPRTSWRTRGRSGARPAVRSAAAAGPHTRIAARRAVSDHFELRPRRRYRRSRRLAGVRSEAACSWPRSPPCSRRYTATGRPRHRRRSGRCRRAPGRLRDCRFASTSAWASGASPGSPSACTGTSPSQPGGRNRGGATGGRLPWSREGPAPRVPGRTRALRCRPPRPGDGGGV